METRNKTNKPQEKKEKSVWTAEKKAELRKLMPEKLNKFGEWFFSDASLKEHLVVKDWRAVMR